MYSVKFNASNLNFSQGVLMKKICHFLAASLTCICLKIQTNALPVLNLKATQKSPSEFQINDPNELMQSGRILYREKKYDEAIVYFEKAAQLLTDDPRPFILIGRTYQRQVKFKNASDAYAKASLRQPDNKEIYLLKAQVDSWRNAIDETLAACHKALELDPTSAEAYQIIGDTLAPHEKHRAEAISAYSSAIKADPKSRSSYRALGSLYETAKDEKNAEEIYRQSMKADPDKMLGRFPLGRIMVKQGRLVEARELWNGRTSDDDSTMPTFIAILERTENLERATAALAKTPNSPEALIQMGLAVMEGDFWVGDGRQERAITYFEQALKLKPNYAKAQYGICKAYIEIAATFPKKKVLADQALVKLKVLSPALAIELEKYRQTYKPGFEVTPLKINK